MTGTALTAASGVHLAPPASSRTTPRGLPRWLWLFGVTVNPLGVAEPDGTAAWIISAGVGPTSVMAVFLETSDQNQAATQRKDQT